MLAASKKTGVRFCFNPDGAARVTFFRPSRNINITNMRIGAPLVCISKNCPLTRHRRNAIGNFYKCASARARARVPAYRVVGATANKKRNSRFDIYSRYWVVSARESGERARAFRFSLYYYYDSLFLTLEMFLYAAAAAAAEPFRPSRRTRGKNRSRPF